MTPRGPEGSDRQSLNYAKLDMWAGSNLGSPACVFGQWRRGPDGQLVRTWESRDASTPSRPVYPKPYDSRTESFWRWFAVAWLAAGYVVTGVAYFLG